MGKQDFARDAFRTDILFHKNPQELSSLIITPPMFSKIGSHFWADMKLAPDLPATYSWIWGCQIYCQLHIRIFWEFQSWSMFYLCYFCVLSDTVLYWTVL